MSEGAIRLDRHPVQPAVVELGELCYDPLYQAVCLAISGRAGQVDWDELTPGDWMKLVVLARSEGVAPLLYRALQASAFRVPEAAMGFLSREYYRTVAQNTLLLSELDRILDVLDGAGIAAIVLKGAALLPRVYGDVGLRPMEDLDLLVSGKDLGALMRCLQGHGYTTQKVTYHAMLQGGLGNQVVLEVHWSLVGNGGDREITDAGWFWENSRLLRGDGLARELTPTANLLYLAAHLQLQHSKGSALKWFYDLHQLICGREAIEWNELAQSAQRIGWESALLLALSGAQARFLSPLPVGFLEGLASSLNSEQRAAARLNEVQQDQAIRDWIRASSSALTWGDKLAWLLGMLFPSRQYLHWRYQPRVAWLWPLYYLRRWGEMVKQMLDTE